MLQFKYQQNKSSQWIAGDLKERKGPPTVFSHWKLQHQLKEAGFTCNFLFYSIDHVIWRVSINVAQLSREHSRVVKIHNSNTAGFLLKYFIHSLINVPMPWFGIRAGMLDCGHHTTGCRFVCVITIIMANYWAGRTLLVKKKKGEKSAFTEAK